MTTESARPDAAQEQSPAPLPPPIDDYFVDNYHWLVLAAWRLSGDKNTAQDLVHDVYEACRTIWASVRDPKAYVARAIVNAAAAEGRRPLRERFAAIRAAAGGPSEFRGPDAAQIDRDHRVNTAVRGLPLRQRQCVVLHHYFSLKQAEIAEMLGLRPATVQTHLIRADKYLRRKLIDLHPLAHTGERGGQGVTTTNGGTR